MTEPLVVDVWSGPRNVSTALMYSWRQRPDTAVFDEPFYGLYLREHDPGHPGRDEVIASMPLDYASTIAHITATRAEPVRYVKNIGHHLDVLEATDVLDRFVNVLLIREPAAVIASLARTMGTDIDIAITGLTQQLTILEHELAAGRRPIVFDAQQLLADPPTCLRALCAAVGLEFDEAMLSWPPGPKPEDGVWARWWYANTHRSTGFGRPTASPIPDEIRTHPILPACRDVYARLSEHLLEL